MVTVLFSSNSGMYTDLWILQTGVPYSVANRGGSGVFLQVTMFEPPSKETRRGRPSTQCEAPLNMERKMFPQFSSYYIGVGSSPLSFSSGLESVARHIYPLPFKCHKASHSAERASVCAICVCRFFLAGTTQLLALVVPRLAALSVTSVGTRLWLSTTA